MKLELKFVTTSLLVTIPSSVGVIAIFSNLKDSNLSILENLIYGILLGIILSFTILSKYKYEIRKQGRDKLEEMDWQTSIYENVKSSLDLEAVYNKLIANSISKNWKLRFDSEVIVGRTGLKLTSLGERIKIEKTKEGIEIQSKSHCRFSIVDYGRNHNNILLLKNIIKND